MMLICASPVKSRRRRSQLASQSRAPVSHGPSPFMSFIWLIGRLLPFHDLALVSSFSLFQVGWLADDWLMLGLAGASRNLHWHVRGAPALDGARCQRSDAISGRISRPSRASLIELARCFSWLSASRKRPLDELAPSTSLAPSSWCKIEFRTKALREEYIKLREGRANHDITSAPVTLCAASESSSGNRAGDGELDGSGNGVTTHENAQQEYGAHSQDLLGARDCAHVPLHLGLLPPTERPSTLLEHHERHLCVEAPPGHTHQ